MATAAPEATSAAVISKAALVRASLRGPSRGTADRDTLIAVWPELHRPEGVRQAREEHHPRLRTGSPGTA